MKPSIVLSITPIIGALIMAACGGGQDQPAAIPPGASPQPEVTPQQGSAPPYGPGPTATPPAPPRSAQGEAAHHEHRERSMGQHDMAAMCPLTVAGTAVRAEATTGGVALVFTTTGDVDELRRKVEHMAEMHNRHHTASPQHRVQGAPGKQAPGQASRQQPGGAAGQDVLPHMSQARAEDTESGARIVFTPAIPEHLQPLRDHVQHHATEMMLTGTCPAQGFMGTQQPGGQNGGEYGGQQYGGPQG